MKGVEAPGAQCNACCIGQLASSSKPAMCLLLLTLRTYSCAHPQGASSLPPWPAVPDSAEARLPHSSDTGVCGCVAGRCCSPWDMCVCVCVGGSLREGGKEGGRDD